MTTKEKLFSALGDLIAEDRQHFARELAGILRRLYPTERANVNAVMKGKQPGKAGVSKAHVQEMESRTFVYGQTETQQATAQSVAPAKKKVVAEKPTPSPDAVEKAVRRAVGFDEPEGTNPQQQAQSAKLNVLNLPTPEGGIRPYKIDALLEMDDNQIIVAFGTLPELKNYIKGVLGASIKRNATTETAVQIFKEAIKEAYD